MYQPDSPSAMKDKNIMDVAHDGAQTVVGGRFSLGEAMMNKKQFAKSKEEIKKIKGIVADMQVYVTEHQIRIKDDLIDEEKLKISMELLEEDMDRRMKGALEQYVNQLKPKIKKRLKISDLDVKLSSKVNFNEFMKQIERMDNSI
jgi:hypothetical protein